MVKMRKVIEDFIEQAEKCKFKDSIGHPLENNIYFIKLKESLMKTIDEPSEDEINMELPDKPISSMVVLEGKN